MNTDKKTCLREMSEEELVRKLAEAFAPKPALPLVWTDEMGDPATLRRSMRKYKRSRTWWGKLLKRILPRPKARGNFAWLFNLQPSNLQPSTRRREAR